MYSFAKRNRRHISKNNIFKQLTNHKIASRFVKENDSILDVGCGSCSFFDSLKKFNNLDLVGFDADKEALSTAKKKGYKTSSSLDIKKKFNIITLSEVIEHMPPEQAFNTIKKCSELLEEKGLLIISTLNPNDIFNLIQFWDTPDHVRPYTIIALKRIAKQCNLLPIKIIKHHLRVNPLKIIVNIIFGDPYAGFTLVLEK